MAGALIIINQSGKPPGIAGAAREDLDLFSGANPIVLTNSDDVDVVSWAWTLLDRPNGSGAVLTGAATASADLPADVRGSYLIRLVTSTGGTNYIDETIAAVVLEGTGWRIAAAGETIQFHPTRGWAEELDEVLRSASEGPRYLREQASNPVTPADVGALFAKEVAGQSELFYRRGGGGAAYQLTPPTLTLQDAYDRGVAVVTSALGPVEVTHGAAASDTEAAILVRDQNANPGRTQALAAFEDATDGSGPIARFMRTASGALGAELQLHQDSASPAADDVVGRISFRGEDSGSTEREYARVDGVIYNPAATTPNGRLSIYARGGAGGGSMMETFRAFADQFGNVVSGTSRLYASYLFGGGLSFYGDDKSLTISGGHLLAADSASVLAVHAGPFAQTSGTTRGWQHLASFAPTSGSAAFVAHEQAVTVNQTGGATGDVTVSRFLVTETAVGGTVRLADWQVGGSRRFTVDDRGNLALQSDDAGAVGPELALFHNSGSPAASDAIGTLLFDGKDAGGTRTTYARLRAVLVDPTNTSEDGRFELAAIGAGSLDTFLLLYGSGSTKSAILETPGEQFFLRVGGNRSAVQTAFSIVDDYAASADALLSLTGDGTLQIGASQGATPGTADDTASPRTGAILEAKKHAGHSGSELRITTGASQTTTTAFATIWTLTIPANTVYCVEAHVQGRENGAGTDLGGFVVRAVVYRSGGGAVLQASQNTELASSTNAWALQWAVSGNSLLLQARGNVSSAETVNWTYWVSYQRASNSTA